MTETTIEELWQAFKLSAQYGDVQKYPEEVCHEAIRFIGMAMTLQGVTGTDWQLSNLQAALEILVRVTPKQPEVRMVVTDILQGLVHFMVVSHLVKLAAKDFADLLTAFRQYHLPEPQVLFSGVPSKWPFGMSIASLPMPLQRMTDQIASETSEWQNSYLASPQWSERPAGVSAEFMKLVVGSFTKIAYQDYRKTPLSWAGRTVTGVLTNYFVTQLVLPGEAYSLVVPTLHQMFSFLGETERLTQQRVKKYQRLIKAAEPKMLAHVTAWENLPATDQLVRGIQTAGIDLSANGIIGRYVIQG
ncbi:hypothetical protein [Levilactobacillus mulengensis]|uniref:hypothetical protein n=1 Tax=Levilactobacillus mulengensis TaxID=2486025 RepID=UPI000F77D36C|nr:hypothetical protein [Levilactobacillus mulengensis]